MRRTLTAVALLFASVVSMPVCSQAGDATVAERKSPSVPAELPPAPAEEKVPYVEELTLRDALARSLKFNPSLASFAWQVRAREAAALQAGLLPNPEFSVEAENVFGSGAYSATGAAETTAALSQLIELGGDRARRREVATLGTELAGWDYQSRRLAVLMETGQSFIAVLTAQQGLEQAREIAELAENFFATVGARVEAGKVSPVEKSRAQVTLSAARTALAQAQTQLTAARRRLAAGWGASDPGFAKAIGHLGQLQPIPAEEELQVRLSGNPDLARWRTEIAQREASVGLARARRIPDLTVSVGGRNFRETNDNAAILGLSIPLPLFDRNQGGIAETRAELSVALHQRNAAYAQALAALAASYQVLSAGYVEADTLEKEVLPAAREAFEATQEGYRAGKFGFLEVLDAQRTLFEVTRQYTEALANYHQARLEVERLVGEPLDKSLMNNGQENP